MTTSRVSEAASPVLDTISTASLTTAPKLRLPKFKGDVKDWTSFWDSFNSSVHENREIPKVDKFNYLNSLLEGAAFRTIQGLPLTASNYDSAIAMLCERLGNTQQIIRVHMEDLLKIPIVEVTDLLHFVQFLIRLWFMFVGWKHLELDLHSMRACSFLQS